MKDWIFFLTLFSVLLYVYIRYYHSKMIDLEDLVDEVNYKQMYGGRTKYQDIDVIQFNPNQRGYNKCLVLDGEIQLCDNDEAAYHEMITHFPAYYLKKLEHVLIVGGGDLMTLREVMKHDTIKSAVMLELDGAVIAVCKKHFGVDDFKRDPRVKIIVGDAAQTIKNLPNNLYDLVIVDSTEDNVNNSPIEQRWFFEECKKKMRRGGILIKNGYITKHMPRETKVYKRQMRQKLRQTFKNVGVYTENIYTYGDTDYSFMMCSDAHDIRDPRQNDEIMRLRGGFKKYDPTRQNKYIRVEYNDQ